MMWFFNVYKSPPVLLLETRSALACALNSGEKGLSMAPSSCTLSVILAQR